MAGEKDISTDEEVANDSVTTKHPGTPTTLNYLDKLTRK